MSGNSEHVLEAPTKDPMILCREWIIEAGNAGEPLPQSAALATINQAGCPMIRMMTVRDLDAEGFVLFTHAASRKASHLASSPKAAISFHWPSLNRQVGASGTMIRLDPATCAAAFARRPHRRQVIALAWGQSEQVADRSELERRFTDTESRLGSDPIEAPGRWIGFRLVPTSIEFWCGHDHGIDERLEFHRDSPSSEWQSRVLAP